MCDAERLKEVRIAAQFFGVKPWQLQQAANAVRIYRYQFRGARKRADAETVGPSWYGTKKVSRKRWQEPLSWRRHGS